MSGRSTETDSEQQRVAELLRSFDVPAPERLHRRVESLVAEHQAPERQSLQHRGPERRGSESQDSRRGDRRFAPRASRRRPFAPLGFIGVGAVALAIVVVAIAIAGGLGGSSHGPSVRQAAAPTLRAATLPAPPESSVRHTQLAAAVDGVKFPYWGERFGWRSTGTRTDRIAGRTVTTVFYTDGAGRRIGYAILAGTPAPRIDGGQVAWRGDVPYRLLSENGASAVVWTRDGHLCVVSGRGVSSATLLRLASWSDREASPS
jgi:hypothetical protein